MEITVLENVLTKEEMAKVVEALVKDSIMIILDDLITEAEKNPEWKAVNALKCAKKEINNLK